MHPFRLVRLPQLDAARKRLVEQPHRLARAGGIDLLDRMKEGLDAPHELVELRAIDDANATTLHHLGLTSAAAGAPYRVGALRTLADLAEVGSLPADYHALIEAAGQAATPSIRRGATLGGNLLQRPRCWYFRNGDIDCLKKGGSVCHAITGENRYHAILGGGPSYIVHPSSTACALVALGGTVLVRSGEPEPVALDIEQLFVSPRPDPTREHRLNPGELVLAVDLPAPSGRRSAYSALREKQSHDWPLAEAAVSLRIEDGRMKDVRVALGHVAPVPWRALAAEQQLEGQAPHAELFATAMTEELRGAKPLRDNGYKVPAAIGVGRDALHRATDLAIPE
ncbi:MAG: xanthine dehydrogenase family protein subunit M [Myxococcales bacterium FL481]|nr:MAG: xanthine dehydrogenase family protein subunit M [Myxococcales bacterium FL481]